MSLKPLGLAAFRWKGYTLLSGCTEVELKAPECCCTEQMAALPKAVLDSVKAFLFVKLFFFWIRRGLFNKLQIKVVHIRPWNW